MTGKIFTPVEATATLPLVKRIVADVLVRGRELLEIHALEHRSVEHQDRMVELVSELEGLFEELESIGCSFRCPNFEYGLIDFPGVIDGQMVHLCWKDDEPDLRYYHDPFAGFAGRKQIPAHLLSPSQA